MCVKLYYIIIIIIITIITYQWIKMDLIALVRFSLCL